MSQIIIISKIDNRNLDQYNKRFPRKVIAMLPAQILLSFVEIFKKIIVTPIIPAAAGVRSVKDNNNFIQGRKFHF